MKKTKEEVYIMLKERTERKAKEFTTAREAIKASIEESE